MIVICSTSSSRHTRRCGTNIRRKLNLKQIRCALTPQSTSSLSATSTSPQYDYVRHITVPARPENTKSKVQHLQNAPYINVAKEHKLTEEVNEVFWVDAAYVSEILANPKKLEHIDSLELSCAILICAKENMIKHHSSWDILIAQIIKTWQPDTPVRHACRVLSAFNIAKLRPSREFKDVMNKILENGTVIDDLATALQECSKLRWEPPCLKKVIQTIRDCPHLLEVQSAINLLSSLPRFQPKSGPQEFITACTVDVEEVLTEKLPQFNPIDCGSLVQVLSHINRGGSPLFLSTLRMGKELFVECRAQQFCNMVNAVARAERDVPWFWEAFFNHMRKRKELLNDFTSQGLTTLVQAMSRAQVSDQFLLQQISEEIRYKKFNEAEIALLANGLSNLNIPSDTIVQRIMETSQWIKLGHLAMALKALGKWELPKKYEQCAYHLKDFPPQDAPWVDISDVGLGAQLGDASAPSWLSECIETNPRKPKAKPLAIVTLALSKVKGGEAATWSKLADYVKNQDASPEIYATLCKAFHTVTNTRKEPFCSTASNALEILKLYPIPVQNLSLHDLAICLLSLKTDALKKEVLKKSLEFHSKDACIILSGLKSDSDAFSAFWDKRAITLEELKQWHIKDVVRVKSLLLTDEVKKALGFRRADFLSAQLTRHFQQIKYEPELAASLLEVCQESKDARQIISYIQSQGHTFPLSILGDCFEHCARLDVQLNIQMLNHVDIIKQRSQASSHAICQIVSAIGRMDLMRTCDSLWIDTLLNHTWPINADPRILCHLYFALFPLYPQEILQMMTQSYSSKTWSELEERHLLLLARDWYVMNGNFTKIRLRNLRILFDVVSSDIPPPEVIPSMFQDIVLPTLPSSYKWNSEVRVGQYRIDFLSSK